MDIYWVVTDIRPGPRRVNDPSRDVYSSYSEAKAECENRGQGFVPLVLNPQEVIHDLIAEWVSLTKENQVLRAAIDAADDFQKSSRGRRRHPSAEDLI